MLASTPSRNSRPELAAAPRSGIDRQHRQLARVSVARQSEKVVELYQNPRRYFTE